MALDPNAPQAQFNGPWQPQGQTPAAPAFDINALIQAFAQMQHQQGQQRLQGQQQFLNSQNPLGATAMGNSRPQGLSSEADWRSMFPQQAGASLTGASQYQPPTQAFDDAAVGASQAQPQAQALRQMQPQNPFVGMQPPQPPQPPMQPSLPRRPVYRPPSSAFGASAYPNGGFAF